MKTEPEFPTLGILFVMGIVVGVFIGVTAVYHDDSFKSQLQPGDSYTQYIRDDYCFCKESGWDTICSSASGVYCCNDTKVPIEQLRAGGMKK